MLQILLGKKQGIDAQTRVMKITVIGAGYVGLVAGVCFAEMGYSVIMVDTDKKKLSQLRQGLCPIYEAQLETLLVRNLKRKRIAFTGRLSKAVVVGRFLFLALPTPPCEDGSSDLRHVLGVAEDIGSLLSEGYTVIVNKSTVPVGTTARIRACIAGRTSAAFDVVSNPEFLRQGIAVKDFMNPDRILIGTDSEQAREEMRRLYAPFLASDTPLLFMDEASSELTKYAANAFLATKLTFINEIANICEHVGATIDDVRRGISLDNRIGKEFLSAGIGWGGSCLPKDVRALQNTSQAHGYQASLIEGLTVMNTRQRLRLLEKARAYFKELKGKVFGIWGLAFKADTDDTREAPALSNLEAMHQEGIVLRAYDPQALPQARERCQHLPVHWSEDMYEALEGVDALFIMTDWPVFSTADAERMKQVMKAAVIFDGRNLYDPTEMKALGFTYFSIGRGVVS